jgi:hypothetical protein
VQGGEAEHAFGRLGRRLQGGHPEIGEHGFAELGDEDVLGLHVPVQQARAMSGLERPGDLDADPDGLGRRQGADLAHVLGQGLPAELEDEDRPALRSEKGPEKRRYVRMVAQ